MGVVWPSGFACGRDDTFATCHIMFTPAPSLVRTRRTRALLACWCSVCFAPDGRHIAVADQFNHRIRLVDAATGRVSTLAGSGAAGFADGSGADAAFNYPTGAAWSWAPSGSARDTAGAVNGGGVGSAGSSITPASAGGAGAGAAAVVIAVADQVRTGWVTSPVTFTPAPPTPRTLPYRSPLVPSFFVLRCSLLPRLRAQFNNRVRLVVAASAAAATARTATVTTLAGSGVAALIDTDDPADTTAATTGAAPSAGRSAAFNNPTGVSFAPDGKAVAVADTRNHVIRSVLLATGAVSTVTGSGQPPSESAGAAGTGAGTAAAGEKTYPSAVAHSPDGRRVVWVGVGGIAVDDATGTLVYGAALGNASSAPGSTSASASATGAARGSGGTGTAAAPAPAAAAAAAAEATAAAAAADVSPDPTSAPAIFDLLQQLLQEQDEGEGEEAGEEAGAHEDYEGVDTDIGVVFGDIAVE